MANKTLIVIGAAAVLTTSAVVVWSNLGGDSSSAVPEGDYPLLCMDPACGHQFAVSEDEIRAWPRDEGGTKLKCDKCGKMTAELVSKCSRCGKSYQRDAATGRMNTTCPQCSQPPAELPKAS